MTNEMLYEILGEINESYVKEARTVKTKYTWLKWVAACMCIVIIGGVVWSQMQGVHDKPRLGDEHLEESLGIVQREEEPEVRIDMSTVSINEFQAASSALLYFDYELYNPVSWGKEEVISYFGKDLTPAYIPEDLIPSSGNGNAKVVLNKDGSMAHDTVNLSFKAEEFASDSSIIPEKGFCLSASKIGIFSDCLYITPDDEVKVTVIGETEVVFGYRSMSYGPYEPETKEPAGYYDLYVAEFEFDGIEYQIVAERMKLEEVVKVVASIIYNTDEVEVIQGR